MTHLIKRRRIKAARQDGAILFISLIILLLITLIAIGSTRLSTLGQRASLSYQLQNTAFQAADSALDGTRRLLEESEFALDQATNGELIQSYNYTDDTTGIKAQATTSTVFREKISDSGSSLGVGKGLPQLLLYETTSTATMDGYKVTSELEQGYQIRSLNQ